MKINKNKAVFLDRDGVINKKLPNDYVKSWAEFEFLPGVQEAIKLLNEAKFKVIVVTNQAGVGKEIVKEEQLRRIHQQMLDELKEHSAQIDAVYYCPHRQEDNCNCRKPKPGLLQKAGKEFNIDFKNSWMIGDEPKDIEAGKSAGCKTYQVTTNEGLLEIVKKIIREL
ncbi:MAG: D-glycero-beta-D-manno-heptose 1,7-bisphosphate 7-phosphatase [Nitrospirota bacterium]